MRFAQEIWLYLVPALLLLWLVLRATDRRASRRLSQLLGNHASDHVENASPRLVTWRRFLLFAGMFLLLLALARPQWGASEVTVMQRGSDIVIALDISNSMVAEDVLPSRMERAKTELGSFLARLEDSRVGMVFFAGSAFVQCPLTLDYGTADIFLKMAGPDMLSEQGTAIAAALSTSRELLRKGRDGSQSGSFQAILLVTDGEDLEGNWEKEAKACRQEGIRVIPVGVGDEGGGLIPLTDAQGRSAGFMKDDQDNVVMTRLDLGSLEKLAQLSGGGSTFRIGVDGLAGDRLFAELQRLGRRDLEDRRISAYQERYMWPLLLGALLLAVRLVIRARESDSLKRISSFRGTSLILFALVLSGGIGATEATAGIRPPGASEAAKARELYLAGSFEEALAGFEAAVVQAPDDPLISLATGETLFQLERYEEAVREFERTLGLTDDPELRSEALYNAGTTHLAAGDSEAAIDNLRSSLNLEADRQDALFNLETALRRLQQQEQQQEQQDQQQDNQEEQDQENQEDQEQQENQDQQDQQEKENQEQQEQEQQEQEEQEQQEQEEQEQPQPEPGDSEEQEQPDESQLTPEQAMQILNALDRDEEELKRSVQKRLKGGKPRSGKKW